MNTLQGQFSIKLGKKTHKASLSLNALRLMTIAFGVKLSEIDKWMNDDPLTAIPAFAYYGIKNEAARSGKDSGLPDFETFCAQVLADEDQLNLMVEAVTGALGGADDVKGNS